MTAIPDKKPRRTLFISDLHLENSRPEMTYAFINFLQHEAIHSDALYILGDLFEYYLGDDENSLLHQEVVHALMILKTQNVPTYIMHGNRDFLIGKLFAKKSGAILIEDPTVIDLYGKKTLLMHGDTLCTQDIKYLAFRKKVRNVFLQKLFLARSLKKRQEMADKGRKTSRMHTQTIALSIMDVTPEEIPRIMEKHQVTQLIHGHTHQPSLHYLWKNQKVLMRTVLSDWHKMGHYLAVYPDGRFRTEFFSL